MLEQATRPGKHFHRFSITKLKRDHGNSKEQGNLDAYSTSLTPSELTTAALLISAKIGGYFD
jgi:hypothetical protein